MRVPPLPTSTRARATILAVAGAAVVLGIALPLILLLGDDERAEEQPLAPRVEAIGDDPFGFQDGRVEEFERRAAFGRSHVLYTAVPGGAVETARRVAAFRPLIEEAAEGAGLDPDLVEALVYVESAGRPDVIAGDDPESAAGLTQILAQTATDFLDMDVDLPTSRELTRRIAEAEEAGDVVEVERLKTRRREVDERFDPAGALAGTMRYLSVARARFGRDDLAFVSYHMGIGNLEGVLRAYAGVGERTPIADVVADQGLAYAKVFFDSAPDRNPDAWERLKALSDDSRNYYWKVLGAREIMRLYRVDRPELERIEALMSAKNSSEEALHPPDTTERFAEPGDISSAREANALLEVPDDPRLWARVDPALGELAADLGQDRELYRALRPEAIATLLYLTRRIHEITGGDEPLRVTSAVRDQRYQDALARRNVEATGEYSLHTTGYAFDILRKYESDEQAAAFQFVLERLEALGVIAWVREPEAIHVTVGPEAAPLVPMLLRPVDDG